MLITLARLPDVACKSKLPCTVTVFPVSSTTYALHLNNVKKKLKIQYILSNRVFAQTSRKINTFCDDVRPVTSR